MWWNITFPHIYSALPKMKSMTVDLCCDHMLSVTSTSMKSSAFFETYKQLTKFVPVSRFLPSQAKAIAEEVVRSELEGQIYDEEDAKAWSNIICDKVRTQVTGQ